MKIAYHAAASSAGVKQTMKVVYLVAVYQADEK
jgi:hypothetical protein